MTKVGRFFLTAVFLFLLLFSKGIANEIKTIRHSFSDKNIRIVIELPENISYAINSRETEIIINFQNANFSEKLLNYKILHGKIKEFNISNIGNNAIMTIDTDPKLNPKIFQLKDPFRLVIDLFNLNNISKKIEQESITSQETIVNCEKEFMSKKELIHTNNISSGLSLFEIEEIVHSNILTGKALLIDPKKFEIFPVIATSGYSKKQTNVIENLLTFFGFSQEQQKRFSHFARKTVLQFLKMYDGIAAINGSFFFADSTPVGTLIINRQIISSPIYNRTSLIINDDNSFKIAPVKMSGFLKLKNNKKIPISGINQPLKNNKIIVYTPDYQIVGYNNDQLNIVVQNGKVEKISFEETKIPENGFVISVLKPYKHLLEGEISVGDTVEWFFMTNPSLLNMKHVISGGPRLVYEGKSCITAQEEKFKADVTKNRANRTALGIKKNGEIILLTVEKATLEELARLMIDLGAYDAMNLDGGGSSSMAVNNKHIFGGNRAVPNALIIKPISSNL